MAKKAPPIPKIVPIPAGYRRAKPIEVTKQVLDFARTALEHALPIGKQQSTAIIGPLTTNDEKLGAKGKIGPRMIIALTEWHYDNHPAGGKGDPFWHPGISMLVPTNEQLHQPAPLARIFPTEQQGMPKSTNEFAGDGISGFSGEGTDGGGFG
jgi:hypothetical protein